MGNLVKEIPYSEVTATLEALAAQGITREHLALLRKDYLHAITVANVMMIGYKSISEVAKRFSFDKTQDGWKLIEDVEPNITALADFELSSFGMEEDGNEGAWASCVCERVKKQGVHLFGQRDAEWLLKHQNRIPRKSGDAQILFPGTVWDDGRTMVAPYLYKGGGKVWGLFFVEMNRWYTDNRFPVPSAHS